MENGQLENLYYGKAIRDREDFTHLHEEMSRPLTSVCIPEPGVLNMQCTKQEYPVYGTGDYRSPAFTVKQESGSKVVNFTYVSHEMYHGKKQLLLFLRFIQTVMRKHVRWNFTCMTR